MSEIIDRRVGDEVVYRAKDSGRGRRFRARIKEINGRFFKLVAVDAGFGVERWVAGCDCTTYAELRRDARRRRKMERAR